MADIVADISVLTVILTITADMASYFGDILNLAITLPLFGKYRNSMGSWLMQVIYQILKINTVL